MNQGLYRLGEFKDNCGFGLVAHLKGQPSHQLVETAIASLASMTHRGGIAADGKTGDGCGLLIQKPDVFFRQILDVELPSMYAVGVLMLSPDVGSQTSVKAEFEKALASEGLSVICWRPVPTNSDCLGRIAKSNCPHFEHVFVAPAPALSEAHFQAKLLIARRLAEKSIANEDKLYVASLSTRVVSYKGLMMPIDLPVFFEDLKHPDFASAICVFHQRFSTNTMPRWPLAQPFRLLAHNGEINTITGNRNWAYARRYKFITPLIPNIDAIAPLVNRDGSDSSSLDNMFELLTTGGMELHRAVRMLLPPGWQNTETMDPDLRAFYEFNSMHMESWDGPAGLALTDGRYAVCTLDRNGLRPSRWVQTKDDIITVASEIGVHNYRPEDVVAKGRLGPGQILSIDTQKGELWHTAQVDEQLKKSQPYKQWLRTRIQRISSNLSSEKVLKALDPFALTTYMKLFQVSFEERDEIIKPLVLSGHEATGSMGDDTPMAVLSQKQRPLYDYFRQQFAQVTNPPIDPLREAIVMSLETCLGRELSVYTETEDHADRVVLSSPLLSPRKFQSLIDLDRPQYQYQRLSMYYNPQEKDLKTALLDLIGDAIKAVEAGKLILLLSDEGVKENQVPIHALLATGAINQALVKKGLRCDANILVKSATIRDSHHVATLIAYGATAIYPYFSYQIINDLVARGEIKMDLTTAYKNYRKGINKGLLKILSKMGIATIASYRGAQLFEIVGLANDVVELCFGDTPSRIQGASFFDLENDQKMLAKKAWLGRKTIEPGGLLKYIHGQEYHAYNPDVVVSMHKAMRSGLYQDWLSCAELINKRPVATLRDLLALNYQEKDAIDISTVESEESIIRRFDSAGMSLGALSPEAHEALAEAMNTLGGRSNSGEGGEDPARYGTVKMSKIKQVASGRFGVTPAYLVNAEVLQIKIAQGAKPGEGGQLPGGKVNQLIATLRYSVPGVTLISPPPHHDIYSIEDLAQLIFDLKQVNPSALISVKLVSRPGVGTIAAGVVKAYADLITVSGYDGGTAASPITSIRYAGSPWELGLSEVHQTLRANDLRGRVRVQTDGGLKTGLDVIKAAILGAESFGFGTAPMVALGCKYLRICHLNNCATGVATQNDDLRREHYRGTVEMVMNFFRFVAQETREWLAVLGVRSLQDLVGRVDLLKQIEGESEKQKGIDLSGLLHTDELLDSKPQCCQVEKNEPFDKAELAQTMVDELLPVIENKTGGEFEYQIKNWDRSIGARLSGEIARRYGNQGMADAPISIRLKGVAGQSLGVWNAGGLHLYLEGDANDYVGKGMAGGKIVISPSPLSTFATEKTVIMGNTCLYGATGGELYASGRAGERFAVRNSGAQAVVTGTGDHCCEYMTGGVVVVLGKTGVNFGAGMTGGFAYVLDLDRGFVDRYNQELVEIHRISGEALEPHRFHLLDLIKLFAQETDSSWGHELADNFGDYVRKFWLVKPKSAELDMLLTSVRHRGE